MKGGARVFRVPVPRSSWAEWALGPCALDIGDVDSNCVIATQLGELVEFIFCVGTSRSDRPHDLGPSRGAAESLYLAHARTRPWASCFGRLLPIHVSYSPGKSPGALLVEPVRLDCRAPNSDLPLRAGRRASALGTHR